jgi:single-strand DNA-binding protein
MSGINSIIITGYVAKQPEYKINKTPVAKLDIIHKVNKDETMYVNCVAFSNNAEYISKYIKKGDFVVVSGKLQKKEYDKVYYTTIVINSIDKDYSNKKEENSNNNEKDINNDNDSNINYADGFYADDNEY